MAMLTVTKSKFSSAAIRCTSITLHRLDHVGSWYRYGWFPSIYHSTTVNGYKCNRMERFSSENIWAEVSDKTSRLNFFVTEVIHMVWLKTLLPCDYGNVEDTVAKRFWSITCTTVFCLISKYNTACNQFRGLEILMVTTYILRSSCQCNLLPLYHNIMMTSTTLIDLFDIIDWGNQASINYHIESFGGKRLWPYQYISCTNDISDQYVLIEIMKISTGLGK